MIDIESATGVQGLIALNIAELAERGINVKKILQIVEDLKQDYFMGGGFWTLDNIFKSGRLYSKLALYLTKFLRIKPIIKMENLGDLHSKFPGLFFKWTMIDVLYARQLRN